MQLGEPAEHGALDHAPGDLLRLVHDEPCERDAGDGDQEQGEHDDEAGGEPRVHVPGQPAVGRGEDHVEDGDADQPRGVGGEGDDEAQAEEQQQQGGALVVAVDERHALV